MSAEFSMNSVNRPHSPYLPGIRLAAVILLLLTFAQVAPGAAQGTTITIAAAADASTEPLRDMINDGLAQEALGFEVEWVEFPYSELYTKLVQNGQSMGSDFDIIMMDDPWIPQFAASGYLANLSQMGFAPGDDFIDTTIALGYWPPLEGPRIPGLPMDVESEIFALPVIGDTQIFFYRTDLVSEAPETWDDIIEIGETLADPANNVYALAMRGVRGNPIVTEWFPYLYSHGGQLFDENWNVKFNEAEGVEALQLFVDLMAYQPEGVANYDSDEQGTCYLQGRCITNVMWTGWILQAEDPEKSQVVGLTGWTTTPAKVRHASQIGNWMMGIPTGSQNQEQALAFLEWVTGPEAQRELANRRGIPVLESVYDDEELQSSYPWLPVVRDALVNSVARPRTPDWAQIEDILGLHLNLAVIGQEGVQEALDNAAAEVTQYLESVGYYAS